MTITGKFTVAATCLLLGACASDIRTDVDPNANFASFRTYAYMEPLATVQAGYTSLVTERFKQAISQQLSARGYALNNQTPDLLVNFHTVNKQKVDYLGVPALPGAMPWGDDYYGYRAGIYGPWPGYVSDPDVMQYTVGVVSIDLIDAKKRQLVWQGVSSSLVKSAGQEKSDQGIETVVAAIFAKYPYVAGNGRPQAPVNK